MSNRMNNKGVTLVEVMISLVILLIVFMGLIQASLLSINHNMRNAVRDEAVKVGAESMSRLRSFNYACAELNDTGTLYVDLIQGDKTNCGYTPTLSAAILSGYNNPQGNFRNFSLPGGYRVAKEVFRSTSDPNIKRLAVRVRWLYPDDDHTLPEDKWQQHTIYYTMRNPAQ